MSRIYGAAQEARVASAAPRAGGSSLRPSSTGYVVCARGDFASSGTVSTPLTGWSPRCYLNAAWNTLKPPSGATKLPLSAGQHRTGIDIALPVGGGIDGTTMQFGTTTPAPGVTVRLFTPGGAAITSTTSSFSDGSYAFTGLTPANYVVCFDGRFVFGAAGYRPQCYDSIAWSG